MKKIIALILTFVLVLTLFSSCASKNENKTNDKLTIVTTIFPEYDWVMNILGSLADEADVIMLLDSGVDLHSYQPTANDIMKVSTCDIFIYIGGESDKWVNDALKTARNDKMIKISLMDEAKSYIKEEEMVEGMQAEEEDAEETAYDEHLWLSLKTTAFLVDTISKAIQTADSQHADVYADNTKAYIEKINELDTEYTKTVKEAKKDTLLFADRFPFRYMTDDYSLKYYAAFMGCSAETEASFETVKFLAKKTDELSLNSIITIDGSNAKIADTVIQNTEGKNQKVLIMNSMQSITAKDVKEGISYLSIMEENLKVLKEALN